MINRRHALTALSGVMATTALLGARQVSAQTTTPESGTKIALPAYKQQTMQVGTLSLQLSELAISRASHPHVKQFAEFERSEQMTIAQVLTDMNKPTPVQLDAQNTAILQQLQSKTGKAFDMAYVQNEIAGHKELMAIQQDFLNGMPTETDDKHIAMLARTVIQMHLTMLADLQTSLTA